MKRKIALLLIVSLSNFVQAQETNDTIKSSCLDFGASYIGDAVYNFSGGMKSGGTYMGMANITMDFDTEQAGIWKGGELFLRVANTHGGKASESIIGDYQVASNIEAGNQTYVQEFWYKQNFGKASFVVGLQDLCIEFLSSEMSCLFINSSSRVHSTIATNMSVPIFPLTSFGGQIHYSFTNRLTLKLALFDGIPDEFPNNKYNLNWKLSKNEGYIFFSELSYNNYSENTRGCYKLGTYYHNGHSMTSRDESDREMKEYRPANYGLYLVADQCIYRNQSDQELSLFTQLSVSPKSINENWLYVGAGLNYKGLFSKSSDDVLGFACEHSGMNNEIGSETTFELTYRFMFGGNVFIQPDIQYIVNPAGTDSKLKNSVVGLLRFGVNLM